MAQSDQRTTQTTWTALNEAARIRGLEDEVEQLRAERQAVLDCINLYGDETLHKALDAIGWLAASESPEGSEPQS